MLERREWILRILGGAAGIALSPLIALGDGNWVPQVLRPDENEALIALGERIIPGSSEANCNRVIDLILLQEDRSMYQQLADAVSSFDHAAQSAQRKLFRQLTVPEQDSILSEASSNRSPLNADFQIVKEWMADTYWSSQQGLRELGSTGRFGWDSFPDCRHPVPHS